MYFRENIKKIYVKKIHQIIWQVILYKFNVTMYNNSEFETCHF